MKGLRNFLAWFAMVLLIAILGLKITGNDHLHKALANTYMVGEKGPTIHEHDIFENRNVETGNGIPINYSAAHGSLDANPELMKQIESYDPVALLVIKGGEIIYDQYWSGYSDKSLSNSFSSAKSIVGLSILKCIELGLIPSLDEPVINYVPELQGPHRADVTIKHLITMTSGINFDESYGNPFGFMAKAYYGEDIFGETIKFEAETEPNTEWKYSGGNTILMSIIVSKVSGQSMSDFVSTHFWKPMGAMEPAVWNLDKKDGIEKAYCCFYSNAVDFSRFGSMMLNHGMFGNKRILDSATVASIKNPVVLKSGEVIPHYGYQWWRMQYRSDNITYARGILGQYIITIPELDMVIVRLGNRRGDKDENQQPLDMYHYIDLAYQLNEEI